MKNILKNLKQFQNLKPFQIVIIVISIFFSVITFLAAPNLFNYKGFEKKLETKINSNFKIHIVNLKSIKYGFLPLPHFLIEQADLKFSLENPDPVGQIKDVKIFIDLFSLYNGKNINIKNIIIENMNMNINYTSLVNFRKHFNTNITRPIEIKNSKIFYINKNDDVSTISPVRKIDYKIDFKSKEKKLKILGKLFDSEYNFELIKNYSNPYKTNLNINFKNPNIRIENNTIKSAEKEFDEGKIKVTFMTNESKYNYKFNNKEINFFKFGKDQSNFNFEGKINLDPFYFNTVITFKKQNFNLILDKLLFNFYNYKESINQNFNGNLNIKFEDIQNNFLKSGLINISFTDSRINLVNNTFNINKIGTLNLKENKFVEIEDKLYFKSSIQIKIENQDEFYRKFSIPKKNRINLKNIFFVLEKDVDNENYYISNIKVNSSDEIKILDDQKSNYEKIKISNIQQLRKVSQNVFESLN